MSFRLISELFLKSFLAELDNAVSIFRSSFEKGVIPYPAIPTFIHINHPKMFF